MAKQIGTIKTQVGIVQGEKNGKAWHMLTVNQKVVIDGQEFIFEGSLFPKRAFSKVENEVAALTAPVEDTPFG